MTILTNLVLSLVQPSSQKPLLQSLKYAGFPYPGCGQINQTWVGEYSPFQTRVVLGPGVVVGVGGGFFALSLFLLACSHARWFASQSFLTCHDGVFPFFFHHGSCFPSVFGKAMDRRRWNRPTLPSWNRIRADSLKTDQNWMEHCFLVELCQVTSARPRLSWLNLWSW